MQFECYNIWTYFYNMQHTFHEFQSNIYTYCISNKLKKYLYIIFSLKIISIILNKYAHCSYDIQWNEICLKDSQGITYYFNLKNICEYLSLVVIYTHKKGEYLRNLIKNFNQKI